MPAVHAVQVNFVPAPEGLAPSALFARWPSVPDIAELVASSGIRVSVIQVAARAQHVTRNGIDYHFVDSGRTAARMDRAGWGRRVAGVLDDIEADIAHVHGLEFAEAASAIARQLPRLPVLLQDHANRPPRWWRRPQWRLWYAAASGIAFSAGEQAQPFVDAGLFGPRMPVFAIPESSSRFTPGERAAARRKTGLFGDPCVLWVGHLTPGKDPLGVLDGVARAAARLPGLQLWCAFGKAPLLDRMQRRVADDARLVGRVHLLGEVAHARIETLMRAADLFVSGSRAESCGFALLEALACGVVPVVTDIPSFQVLTGHGRVGELWPCGDAARLADALVAAASKRTPPAQVRAHFDATLSFAAVGRQWAEAYAQLLRGRDAPR
jgi:glycosyltransferase involved in cell wall biosynthesis